MKKTSLIITILLAIAIAVLYILHFTGIGTGNVASVKKTPIRPTLLQDLLFISAQTLF